MYCLAVVDDTLLVSVRQDGATGFVEDELHGLVAIALPDLTVSTHFWSDAANPVAPRVVRKYMDALVGVASNGQWCMWDSATAAIIRQSAPLSRARPDRFCTAMAGAGRWQFYSYASAFDLETGIECVCLHPQCSAGSRCRVTTGTVLR